jgi:hypothetical protein
MLLFSSMEEDLAGNGGLAKQYNTFSSTAATRLDDGTTARQYAATRLDDGTTARQYNAATPQNAVSCSFKEMAAARHGRQRRRCSGDTARHGKMARQHSKNVLAARRRQHDKTARRNGKTAMAQQDGTVRR